ncbi:hypothetical protein FHW17_001244 [Phyllobacterium sp. P30BS-XVII]|nr:hypothetical protein [Phyllobacterium sp. P30BS-XVII]
MQSQSQRLQIKKLQGTGQNKTPLILSLSKGLMVSLSNHEPRSTILKINGLRSPSQTATSRADSCRKL